MGGGKNYHGFTPVIMVMVIIIPVIIVMITVLIADTAKQAVLCDEKREDAMFCVACIRRTEIMK